MDPVFFQTPEQFRDWLAKHHETEKELWVGFWKTSTGLPSITWPESVEEALCFGWIDGLRKSIDEKSYTIRFIPRRADSTWSAINLKLVDKLIEEKRMKPAGLAAWEQRHKSKRLGYSYSDFDRQLGEAEEAEMKKHPEAWGYFQSQPPSYRRQASYWVMSARREETRAKRLRALIEDSAQGQRLAVVTGYKKK